MFQNRFDIAAGIKFPVRPVIYDAIDTCVTVKRNS